jgi:hypothetical protein
MNKKEFINHLITNNFCTTYEAEEYTVFCGEDGWAYENPFTKEKASQVNNSVQFYHTNIKQEAA